MYPRSLNVYDHIPRQRALGRILRRDDVEEFYWFVSREKAKVDPWNYPGLLEICIQEHAYKCTLHLLQGNLPYGPPDVTNQALNDDKFDYPVLFKAVENMWDPQIYHLLIYHCGAYHHANFNHCGYLPIHFLLHSLVEKDCHLYHWSIHNSLTKLLLLLFLKPTLKQKLDSARIVAAVTDSINDVALGFIQHGEFIQLACLLLVARERAMAPFCSGETIKQHTSLEWIASHVYRGQCSRETIAVAGLLHIFERAGHALSNYHQCMPHNNVVEVSVQVAQIMHEAGFKVTYNDFDLENIYSPGIKAEVLKCIHERLDIAFDGTFKNFDMSKKCRVSLPRIFNGELSSVNHKAQEVAKLAKLQRLGSREYKYNMGKWKYSWVWDLPNLTMKLKRGVIRLV